MTSEKFFRLSSSAEINCTHMSTGWCLVGVQQTIRTHKIGLEITSESRCETIMDGFVSSATRFQPPTRDPAAVSSKNEIFAEPQTKRASRAVKNGQTQNKHRKSSRRAVKSNEIEIISRLFSSQTQTRRSSFESMQMSLRELFSLLLLNGDALSLNLFNRMLASGERSP
jgi:hypothetical protein